MIVLLSLCAVTTAQAQFAGQAPITSAAGSTNTVANSAIQQFLGPISDAEMKRKAIDISNAQGSPYTSFKFAPTTLYYNDEKIGDIFYRYNALNEEVEIKRSQLEEEGYRGLSNDKKISLIIDGKKMAFNTFITSKKRTTNGYLTTLVDGEEYDLFKRITVKYTEGQDAQNSFVAAVPAKFSQFTEYYYQKKGVNRIDEVIAKNSKLLKVLDANEKVKTKEFLKENSLNVKNETDLIKTFEFLNGK